MREIRLLHTDRSNFQSELNSLRRQSVANSGRIEQKVRSIISAVRERGDAAVLEYSKRFDRFSPAVLRIDEQALKRSFDRIPCSLRQALQKAADRIEAFHRRQLQDSWHYSDENDILIGQRITPIARVGLYVPGGKAAYPSTVLMSAIPARVAGVGQICITTPAPDGHHSEALLAACHIAKVKEVYCVGGVQAIAALAYGTDSIAPVDKIVGPGSVWVAEAKRQVFGTVGIDMVAGPSEVVIITDGSLPARWAAIDLFAQAEHDETAQSMLLCHDYSYLQQVVGQINQLLPGMKRRNIISRSLSDRGALIATCCVEESVKIANDLAPEHLQIATANPESVLPAIASAGAIFLGSATPEVLGDYCLGPSHILPTAASARFSSPLGVYDFVKRSSVMRCPDHGALAGLIDTAAIIADHEELNAHALSARLRREPNN